MPSAVVELSNVAGTEAALGWAGAHAIVVDRPEGRAGGMGLGFNGAQLLALTIGGCFCNDLRYVAHAMGVALGDFAVLVTVYLDGAPIMATAPPWSSSARPQTRQPRQRSSNAPKRIAWR
jgi:organic hydroperoxide reductase OsmC/OhrA